MSESSYAQKHTLLCLRLAAECRDLAAAAFTPELRAALGRLNAVPVDIRPLYEVERSAAKKSAPKTKK